ncbi:uncharacterized protein LOC126769096 [Nymphalis io]|uniref:uncharacterized protein LOC126769096 n=1 Tax=Inachis io TaxID=171585 RepID=UPI00216A82E6|nr:uncharacterized protein LOC126769096 [Nymphalis io]
MAPIRYSLHYEDYSEHLMSRFGKLLQMQSLVDMTLMCSSHTLRVHKAVLAASSAYFQEVLQKQTGEPLIILKMRFSVLKCLVEFMYCGKTQCLEENLDELVSAAQFLKIKGLSKVTKEGLGINNHSELPVFTPPVVINRPPQSLIDMHTQDNAENKTPHSQLSSNNNQSGENLNRSNKDMVMRIPFDIDGSTNSTVDYSDPSRVIRPRRGRPSFKRSSGWEGGGVLGRAAERALMRREQDSRKAIHHLKHLQTKHMQDYMERVSLSQAVNSICNNDTASPSYLNMDNDIIYMDQSVSSNSLDAADPFSKDTLGNETITSNYSTAATSATNETSNIGINTAMSQYVNALKSAGLPTDLPILFESGDGSYINVNEQVLLDMVQSSEIQYEVIEQPNIIEKVADPSEIKSIDELSKSIERGEMLMGSKNFPSNNVFDKNSNIHEDTINSLNEILPDNLESFEGQQNFIELDHSLRGEHASMDRDNNNDFSCIDSDMQFFTKSMSDDVKKYYDDQPLNDPRVLDQYCPASTSFDTSFNMSLLDTKTHLGDNTNQQYSSLNTDDLKRNDACYDFSLQLPHTSDFKEDALDCLLSTPKHNEINQDSYINHDTDDRVQEQDEIMKDLMNIENRIQMGNCDSNTTGRERDVSDNINNITLDTELPDLSKEINSEKDDAASSDNTLQWDFIKMNDIGEKNDTINSTNLTTPESNISNSVVDLTDSENIDAEKWDSIKKDHLTDKENKSYNYQNTKSSTLDENIPFAVGLLPLKQVQTSEEEILLKRKNINDIDMLDNVDAKCLKRKTKCKKI